MSEQRKHAREDTINPGISCLLELPNGDTVSGVIVDISDTGARVSGATDRLQTGNEYLITLVVQSYQKVAYRCVVRHMDANAEFYGIEFTSRPQLVEPGPDTAMSTGADSEQEVKRCPVDGRVFPATYRYCPFDKSNLVLEIA